MRQFKFAEELRSDGDGYDMDVEDLDDVPENEWMNGGTGSAAACVAKTNLGQLVRRHTILSQAPDKTLQRSR